MPRKDPELCQKVRDRVDKWEKYWTINRSLYYEWIDFILGDQWKEDESKLFERYDKIPMIVNKCGVIMNHMMGNLLFNTPNLQILPDDDVPPETADIRAALIKNITFNSDSKTVFQTGFWQAGIGGYGAWRVGVDYTHGKSFDQEIMIYEIEDPNRCYWDIAAKHKCKIDGMYAGYKTRMSRKKIRDQWGKNVESQIATVSATEDSTMAFADDDSITVIDDYERVGKKSTIYKLSDGSVLDADEFRGLEKVKIEGKRVLMKDGELVSVMDKREVVEYQIKHRQIAGDFVLEETDFPSEDLPIIFVDQKSYHTKQGQQITRSFFKDVKDAQKYLNYLMTQSAYIMKISRYDQFIMPRKCAATPDAQQQWRDPSIVRGALYYDETPGGEKPEQLRPPELSASLTNEYQRTLLDIQSGTGIYDLQMGDVDGDLSGKAINASTQRGTKNTAVPYNSLNIAITTTGVVINQMVSKVYDTQRTIKLSMPESESQSVDINKPADPYGMQVDNDMTQGRYKIRLKPGPSYEGQKELALESMQSLITADRSGQAFTLLADLYCENLPLDNNIEIRNRLRTIVPPEVIEAGKTGKPLPPKQPQPDPEAMKVQLKQQELQHKMQEAQMNAQLKMKDFELKQAEIQRKAIETHTDMGMQFEKLEADKQRAAAELQEVMLRYQAESERVNADLHMNHSQNIMNLLKHGTQHHHEQDMQERDHKHQKSMPKPSKG